MFPVEAFLLALNAWDEVEQTDVDNVELKLVATEVVDIVSDIVASGAILSLRLKQGSPDPLSALSAETLLRRNDAMGSGSYSKTQINHY